MTIRQYPDHNIAMILTENTEWAVNTTSRLLLRSAAVGAVPPEDEHAAAREWLYEQEHAGLPLMAFYELAVGVFHGDELTHVTFHLADGKVLHLGRIRSIYGDLEL